MADASFYGLIANQITNATIARTTPLHTTGATCFELPLRGESLAAWLNSLFIGLNPIRNAGIKRIQY
jgi:hypothetical protein